MYDVLDFHCCQVSLNVFFGKPGPWFEDCELDGDKNSIFHDVDGSVTGYKDAYVGRIDNYLIRHPSCVNVTKWNAVVCSGNYAQVGQTEHIAMPDSFPAPDSIASVRSTLQLFGTLDTFQSMTFFLEKERKKFIRNHRLVEFYLKFPHSKPLQKWKRESKRSKMIFPWLNMVGI